MEEVALIMKNMSMVLLSFVIYVINPTTTSFIFLLGTRGVNGWHSTKQIHTTIWSWDEIEIEIHVRVQNLTRNWYDLASVCHVLSTMES